MDSAPNPWSLDFYFGGEWLESHAALIRGILIALQGGFAVLGIGVSILAAWWCLRRKVFPHQVIFSLNYLEGRELRMRTLLDATVKEVWPNPFLRLLLRWKAMWTSADKPILALKPRYSLLVHQAVVNRLSPLFSEAFVARSMGHNVAVDQYLFAVTYEKYPEFRSRKFRVMLIRQADLDLLEFAPPQQDQCLQDRLKTLQRMRAAYANPKTSDQLGTVELGVAVSASPGAVEPRTAPHGIEISTPRRHDPLDSWLAGRSWTNGVDPAAR